MPDLRLKDELEFAHDSNVWSLAFHPLGHILCSASNDHTTRFWSRGRPGQRVLNVSFLFPAFPLSLYYSTSGTFC